MQRADPGPVSRSWDDEYRLGRYRGEPPIPFVGRIVDILRDRPETMRGKGLYVGCGNGGLLFVRVNSASTDVYHSHRIVKRGDRGGFTVRYHEGPKRGLVIHFLSLGELREMLDPWFTALVPTREQVTLRQCGPQRALTARWRSRRRQPATPLRRLGESICGVTERDFNRAHDSGARGGAFLTRHCCRASSTSILSGRLTD